MALKVQRSEDTEVRAGKKISPKVQKVSKFDFEAKATRYKELELQIEKNAKKMESVNDEFADVKKELIAYANESAGDDEELEFRTEFGKVKVGKRGTTRVVTDMEKAVEFMGSETFMQVARINLSDIDKYLVPAQIEQCVETKRNDTRRIT